MSKVDDVVGQIKKDYEPGTWDPSGFQDDQAKNSLDALAGLNADEFKEAFDRLNFTPAWSDLGLSENVKKQLVEDAGDLKNDPKYKDIIAALDSGDPKNYVDTKRKAEQEADKPKFKDDYVPEITDEKNHLYWVELPEPRGASEMLKLLIRDTEFTMRRGFDTLGARNPKDAPDFSKLLDTQEITTADGWSQVKKQADHLKTQLGDRQTAYDKDHKAVDVDTEDTKILKSDTFKKLKDIVEDLKTSLKLDFWGGPQSRRDGDVIKYSAGPPSDPIVDTIYKKGDDGFFYLTPEAEQRYYVKALDQAADDWEKEYATATDQFQKKADDIDKKGDKNDGSNNNKNANDNSNNNNNNSNNNNANNGTGNNNTYVPPGTTGNTSTQQPGATNEDWSSTYDDLIDGSTDPSATETGTGTQPISDSGSVDTSSSGAYPGVTPAGLQTGTGAGTTGTNTGANTGSVAPASNTGDNGMANAMQQMAMMSAMSGMMNQGNRQPDDDRAYDRAAERERREDRQRERERNRNAQPATANQAVQQTAPPGVTAPTSAGTPPAVTTPGMTPGVRIGDTMVNASPPIAEALQKQTQNTALDAVSAYKGTAGEITAEHPPAVVNGPGELKTGDILQWEKFSALVVRNPNGMDGLFVLDGGKLIPLDPNNPPLTEKYGYFTGYIHPTGLDTGSNTADPGATAPPPPTLSTAQPSGPPPVGPPPQV
ncbi:hypothetical protein ABZ511_12170 [Nocardia gamkensis]|uniref:hypothetical protein n=1 Tax=Nocardia gamkensis TaxID=352869 RepID=UPI0033E85821